MKKNLSKILRQHNQAKLILNTPVPAGMYRMGNPKEYLIGNTHKAIIGNGTWDKQKLNRRIKSLRSYREAYSGLTPEQAYEKLFKYPTMEKKTFDSYANNLSQLTS